MKFETVYRANSPGVDLLEEAVNRLTAEHGTLLVVAAGNSGRESDETVGSPPPPTPHSRSIVWRTDLPDAHPRAA